MELNEKIDRLVKFLNICPQCLSSYLVNIDRTYNEYNEYNCNFCNHKVLIPNPTYISPQKRMEEYQKIKENTKIENDIEELMEHFTF